MNYFIVNENVTLGFKAPVTGTITILPVSLTTVISASGAKVYNNIMFTVTEATNGNVVKGTGVGTLQGNSIKLKGNSLPVLRDDAEVTIIITGIVGSIVTTFTATIVILNAGQAKLKGI